MLTGSSLSHLKKKRKLYFVRRKGIKFYFYVKNQKVTSPKKIPVSVKVQI